VQLYDVAEAGTRYIIRRSYPVEGLDRIDATVHPQQRGRGERMYIGIDVLILILGLSHRSRNHRMLR
jgi:hypothetical protein